MLRAELITYLSPDWDFATNIGFIPTILLHYVARYPHVQHDHSLGLGDSFEAPFRPIVEGSLLTDLYVRNPVLENLDVSVQSAKESRMGMEEFSHVNFPSGDFCHLFWLIPITLAECYIKQSEGPHALDIILTDNSNFILDIDRPCYVAPENRAQRRAREKVQRLRAKRPPLKSVYDLECMMHGHGQRNHE